MTCAMEPTEDVVDAIIIGGGFYGCAIAIYLARHRNLKVLLIERENALMQRASYNNQARVHNGYHYPRSFVTAYRSRINLPQFVKDWPDAVLTNFTKLYAIARRNSKVTSKQFQKFCREIGASLAPADLQHRELFNNRLIEDVFLVQEYAFDTTKLAKWATDELKEVRVDVHFATRANGIVYEEGKSSLKVQLSTDGGDHEVIARYVFNCTYSGINQLRGDFPGTSTKLKHEITEMALIKMPPMLESLGITVMDGPFFSMMPFPARGLHTLSHVRYTPHLHWLDQCGIDPYECLDLNHKATRVDRMLRDVERYMPAVADVRYVDSLFEVKSILVKNEADDGRPILFERHENLPGCYSILGSKIDNIYDVIKRLEDEFLF